MRIEGLVSCTSENSSRLLVTPPSDTSAASLDARVVLEYQGETAADGLSHLSTAIAAEFYDLYEAGAKLTILAEETDVCSQDRPPSASQPKPVSGLYSSLAMRFAKLRRSNDWRDTTWGHNLGGGSEL